MALGHGLQYFYGFMGGETDQWTPYLFQNNKQIFPWIGKSDYNLITDMADEAISYMKELNAAARGKPFFVYYVPGGSHSAPAPKEWAISSGQVRHGLERDARADLRQPEAPRRDPGQRQVDRVADSLPKWDTLSADQKKLLLVKPRCSRATAYTDNEISRVIQQVEDMGKLDNTLIIYIVGDNGTSPEGTLVRDTQPVHLVQRHPGISSRRAIEVLRRVGLGRYVSAHGGGVVVGVRYAPFKWTKQIASRPRNAPGSRDLGPRASGCRRCSPPVPPHHRHRADDPRRGGHQGTADSRRYPAKTDRRRQHGVHLRQGQRGGFEAQDPILRNDRQPRHLSRRLVCQRRRRMGRGF
jgi:arylsulfatase A-like enzyme